MNLIDDKSLTINLLFSCNDIMFSYLSKCQKSQQKQIIYTGQDEMSH